MKICVFFAVLKKNNLAISRIENPTFHLNLETSEVFLNKTKIALENLFFLYNSDKNSREDSKIIKAFEFLKKLKLAKFSSFLFQKKSNQN